MNTRIYGMNRAKIPGPQADRTAKRWAANENRKKKQNGDVFPKVLREKMEAAK